MKLAIFKALVPSNDKYTFDIFKKIHGKWHRVDSVDDLQDLNLSVPSAIVYNSNVHIKVYGTIPIYFGDHTLLKSTLPEYFL